MQPYTLQQRAVFYQEAFPDWPDSWPMASDRWLSATWMIGNDYRNATRLHGAYPPHYLDRVMALFPDAEHVLHLFSGSLPPGPYTRLDQNLPEGEALELVEGPPALRTGLLQAFVYTNQFVQGDAHYLPSIFNPHTFDLILADPPYAGEDAEHYGTIMCRRGVVIAGARQVLKPGGHLCWLDQALPIYSKRDWHRWGAISVWRSTNHRIRGLSIFQRPGG